MIKHEKFTLDNGLRVVVHEDKSTPLVAVNILYDVGSRDESPDRTGFAHLFEHLMFGGSLNVKDFDTPIQNAGGENNAFTNCDITNFYNIVPANNIETAFWLESDRMLQLSFSQETLDVQKKVVVEEFKETAINKPYGDLWHRMSSLAFKNHPYRWPTIGLKPEHISDASLDDVKEFFFTHYRPNNAILSVSGNVTLSEIEALAKKWFGPIPSGVDNVRSLIQEPVQENIRTETVRANVPSDALYIAFPMPGRKHPDFAIYDLISDVLSGGHSSRFHSKIVKPATHFTNLYAYITGSLDPGLFFIEGKLLPGVDIDEAYKKVWEQLEEIKQAPLNEKELAKNKNRFISSLVFSDVSILNKAINLAFYELLGDSEAINKQIDIYNQISSEDILRVANDIFVEEKSNVIKYLKDEG